MITTKLNRFLVFAGDAYYPTGGWEDFRGSFVTLEAARAFLSGYPHDWGHIIDITTGEFALT